MSDIKTQNQSLSVFSTLQDNDIEEEKKRIIDKYQNKKKISLLHNDIEIDEEDLDFIFNNDLFSVITNVNPNAQPLLDEKKEDDVEEKQQEIVEYEKLPSFFDSFNYKYSEKLAGFPMDKIKKDTILSVPGDDPFFYIGQDFMDGQGNKRYARFDKKYHRVFMEQLLLQPIEVRCLNETLTSIRKMYYDIDCPVLEPVENMREIIDFFCKMIDVYFNEYYGYSAPCVILDSSGKSGDAFKHSYHIIIEGHCYTYQTCLHIFEMSIAFLKEKEKAEPETFPDRFSECVFGEGRMDPTVYSKNRMFRMIYCCKKGSDRFLKFIPEQQDFDVMRSLISHIPDDCIFNNISFDEISKVAQKHQIVLHEHKKDINVIPCERHIPADKLIVDSILRWWDYEKYSNEGGHYMDTCQVINLMNKSGTPYETMLDFVIKNKKQEGNEVSFMQAKTKLNWAPRIDYPSFLQFMKDTPLHIKEKFDMLYRINLTINSMPDDLPELIQLMNRTYIDFYDAIEDINKLSKIFNKEKYVQMKYREQNFKLLFMRILNKVHKIKIGPKPTILLHQNIFDHVSKHKIPTWTNSTLVERDMYFNKMLEYKKIDKKTGNLIHYYTKSKLRLTIAGYLNKIDEYMFDSCTYVVIAKETDYSDKDSFNLFDGYYLDNPTEERLKEDTELFRYHIHDILCSSDEQSYDYLSHWIAFATMTLESNKTCVFLVSEEHGTGKTIFVELLQKLMGKYISTPGSMEDVTGFNETDLLGKVIVALNELDILDKQNHDTMKRNIDANSISIEQKNKPLYKIRNQINYIGMSNYVDGPVWIENKTERRFFIQRVSAKKRDELEYFNRLKNISTRAIYNYLKSIDLTDWEPKKIYRTELYMKIAARTEHYLTTFFTNISSPDFLENSENICAFDTYASYLEKYEFNAYQFDMKIIKIGEKKFMFMKKEHLFKLILKWREENTHHEKKILLTEMMTEIKKYDFVRFSYRIDITEHDQKGNKVDTKSFRGVFIDVANIRF